MINRIELNVEQILRDIPSDVKLVAATKMRTAEEIDIAISAGISRIGENYIQEAESKKPNVVHKTEWHLIGHLQKNKVRKAVRLFDMIQTVDSPEIAAEISSECSKIDKTMPVLVEINSGREQQKNGVHPEKAGELIASIAPLKNIKICGLMTMGPNEGCAATLRPYFKETHQLFSEIRRQAIPGIAMDYLSMGMSNSYRIAIEEGANIIRVGSILFGERL